MRTALVSLDAAPAWFVRSQAGDHLTAQQARQYAATDGECTAMLHMMQNYAFAHSQITAASPSLDTRMGGARCTVPLHLAPWRAVHAMAPCS